MDERIVQAVWHEQFLRADLLRTCSGKSLRIIDPGKWNGEAGPDFRMAELEIGGRRVRGDVEIHLGSSDWHKHRHDRDFEYDGVILHAFLHATDRNHFDTLHNGQTIERVELAPAIHPDLETVQRSLDSEEFLEPVRPLEGRCHKALEQADARLLRDFFAEAGRKRMEAKIARHAAQLTGESPDQILYQAIMTAMGYKGAKTLFFLLAKRTPIEEMKDYLRDAAPAQLTLALESILLNVANLAVTPGRPCADSELDAETQEYLNALNRWWGALSGYYRDRVIPPTRRWFGGTRPVNFPTRRIAGVARLLSNCDFRRGLLRGIAASVARAAAREPKTVTDFRREIAQLTLLFTAEGPTYWSMHYTIGGRKTRRPMHLIGEDRARSVLFNAVLPMLILDARRLADRGLEGFLWQLFDNFPALSENAVTRFMRRRLFGTTKTPPVNFRLESNNQALFHVFSECCNNNALTCDDCAFFGMLK